jgi:hypothetical protein
MQKYYDQRIRQPEVEILVLHLCCNDVAHARRQQVAWNVRRCRPSSWTILGPNSP